MFLLSAGGIIFGSNGADVCRIGGTDTRGDGSSSRISGFGMNAGAGGAARDPEIGISLFAAGDWACTAGSPPCGALRKVGAGAADSL